MKNTHKHDAQQDRSSTTSKRATEQPPKDAWEAQLPASHASGTEAQGPNMPDEALGPDESDEEPACFVSVGAGGSISINSGPSPIVELMLSTCWKGAPTDRLAHIIGRLPREELEQRYVDLHDGPEGMPRSITRLAQCLAAHYVEHARSGLAGLRSLGPEAVEQIRILAAAGGRIDTPRDEIVSKTEPTHLFPDRALFPYRVSFRTAEGIAYLMPREIREAIAGVDWDEQEDLARRYLPAVDYLSALVQWRGIVNVAQAYPEYAGAIANPLTLDELIDSVLSRYAPRAVPCILITNDIDYWLVHRDVMNLAATQDAIPPTRYVLDCIQCNEQREPRPLPPDVTDEGEMMDWIMDLPSCQELTKFLEGHTPKDEDEWAWSWELIYAAYDLARKSPANSETFCELVRNAGCRLGRRPAKQLLRLHQAFARDVPRWALNGWSATEDVAEVLAAG